jgi:hypothetical protein
MQEGKMKNLGLNELRPSHRHSMGLPYFESDRLKLKLNLKLNKNIPQLC